MSQRQRPAVWEAGGAIMASKINQNRILDQFFGGRGGDALFSCEAVSAYYGAAGARDVYAV